MNDHFKRDRPESKNLQAAFQRGRSIDPEEIGAEKSYSVNSVNSSKIYTPD